MAEIDGNIIILDERYEGEGHRIICLVNKVLESQITNIYIDMKNVTFINSIAIGEIVKSFLLCKEKNVKLNVLNYSEDIRRSLKYSGVLDLMGIEVS